MLLPCIKAFNRVTMSVEYSSNPLKTALNAWMTCFLLTRISPSHSFSSPGTLSPLPGCFLLPSAPPNTLDLLTPTYSSSLRSCFLWEAFPDPSRLRCPSHGPPRTLGFPSRYSHWLDIVLAFLQNLAPGWEWKLWPCPEGVLLVDCYCQWYGHEHLFRSHKTWFWVSTFYLLDVRPSLGLSFPN